MDWRGSQTASRNRHLAKYDAAEAKRYDSWVGHLSQEGEAAYLSDLKRVFQFKPGTAVLDVGAGTGALCKVISRLPGVSVTALEPAPAMLAVLKTKAELQDVAPVEGFCDAMEDRRHFSEAQFDAVVCRQVVNGLFDPLTAFSNWHYWLSPGGRAIVVDGLYGRDAWTGEWQAEVDVLPLSASQSTATTPYLLKQAGFLIEAVEWMEATNAMASTKTDRYVVVARKHA